MKKIIIVFFLFTTSFMFGQYNIIEYDKIKDSLIAVTKNAKIDTLIISAYNELSILYKEKHKLDSSLFFVKKSYELADKVGNARLKSLALISEGNIYHRKASFDKAFKKYMEALELIKDTNDDKAILAIYANIGVIYQLQNEPEKSISYLLKALDLSKKIKDPIRETMILFNISRLYFYLKSYQKSLEYGLKINQVKEENNLKYFLNAQRDNLIGAIYSTTEEYDKAIPYLEEALAEAIIIENVQEEAIALTNLGKIYLDFKKDLPKSESYLKRAIQIQESMDNRLEEYAITLINLAGIKNTNSQFNEGIVLANKALEFAKQKKHTSYEMGAYEELASLYENSNQFEKALKSHQNFKILSDSIAKVESLSVVADLDTKYQIQQKENDILQLTNENIQKEASLTQSRYTIFGVLGVLILVLSLVYFYWTKRKQQHKLALLENSVVAIEQEKSRIGKELHDNIAGSLMKLVHDSETIQVQLSHKLLQAYNEIRGLSHQLDNTPMHGEPFLDRVMDIIPENSKTQEFTFNITPPYLQIDEPYGTHVFRMIQELITNNLKYANASETKINLTLENNVLTLVYKDNGIGASNFKKGNGYRNIENRIALMNSSTLEIEPQNGFDVTITIPYST